VGTGVADTMKATTASLTYLPLRQLLPTLSQKACGQGITFFATRLAV
jgi:hypothetical protein